MAGTEGTRALAAAYYRRLGLNSRAADTTVPLFSTQNNAWVRKKYYSKL